MLNTYIYHLLLRTYFGVRYTICKENIALFAQEIYEAIVLEKVKQ